jgi:hypothetical protein
MEHDGAVERKAIERKGNKGVRGSRGSPSRGALWKVDGLLKVD